MTANVNVFDGVTGKLDGTHEPAANRVSRQRGFDFGRAMTKALSAPPPKPNAAEARSGAKASKLNDDAPSDETISRQNSDDDRKKIAPRDEAVNLNSLLALLAQPAPPVAVPVAAQSGGENLADGTSVIEESSGDLFDGKQVEELPQSAAMKLECNETVGEKHGSQVGEDSQASAVASAKERLDTSKEKWEGEASSNGPKIRSSTDAQLESSSSDEKAMTSVVPADGKADAKQEQRMKFSEEKNKIAGLTQQKLPRSNSADENSSGFAEMTETKSVSGSLEKARETIRVDLATNWMTQPAAIDSGAHSPAETVSPASQAAEQVEKLGRMISGEVVVFRQTGANQVGVSLQLDSQTEIFLTLTQHAGQTHASIRCERGDFTGLEAHWKQLQESLARHEVQLLPVAESHASKDSTFNSQSNQSSQYFEQARQNRNREQQPTDFSEELSFAEAGARSKISATKSLLTKIPQGWESWA